MAGIVWKFYKLPLIILWKQKQVRTRGNAETFFALILRSICHRTNCLFHLNSLLNRLVSIYLLCYFWL